MGTTTATINLETIDICYSLTETYMDRLEFKGKS